MKLGMFGQAAHPPGKTPYECQEWDLQVIRWMDEFGYEEAWFGEHHALPWEPNPAPDILIAQALRETKRIRLGPGGICLPYHNPAVVANRMAWLDNVAQGRFNFGVAAGAVPADWKLLGINGADTRDMTRESLEIIRKIWTGERPFVYEGKYWRIEVAEPIPDLFDVHIMPFQKPCPPIGVSGLSPSSPTLKIAGRMGFLPMSLASNTEALVTHWEAYEQGALAAGRTPDRADWRVVKEIIIAETDAEAEKIALKGGLGEYVTGYLARTSRWAAEQQGLPWKAEEYTPEYFLKHTWIVGSPATVREKLGELQHDLGGFGTLLVFACDYSANPTAWRDSLRALAEEVAPKLPSIAAAA
jgi:alkanesulfonate monooxygenase SsuD/methylene tetrahydromethanopterin reductase-like flavin-dependent oxidoreductase (luciferase family)